MSVGIGLAVGIVLGMIPIPIPGVGEFYLGTDDDVSVASYAAAYPAALVMMTILAQVLIALFN